MIRDDSFCFSECVDWSSFFPEIPFFSERRKQVSFFLSHLSVMYSLENGNLNNSGFFFPQDGEAALLPSVSLR